MDRLFDDLDRFADRLALIDEQGSSHGYADFLARADSLVTPLGTARRLVALEADNRLESLALYVGALRAGHAVLLTGHGGAAPDGRIGQLFRPHAVHRADGNGGWVLERRHDDPVALHPRLAVLLSTSGSTGSPKLIRLSHDNLRSNATAIADYLAFADGERAITSLPPYYSYGMSVINSHLVTGNALILNDASVSEDAFWARAERHGATSFAGVPHSYDLLERTGFLGRAHPALRYYTQAGGRLPPEKVSLFAADAAAQGRRFYVMYGQTEAAPRMGWLPPERAVDHPDCIGLPVPGGEFRLDAPDGGQGELIFRGSNVMMGYANDPSELALGQGPDELRTGDIAERDASGLFRIVGRASRFSKLFGLRIGLDDVEARLRAEGVEAFVAGDDEGIVVATTARDRAGGIAAALSQHFRLPVGAIAVLPVDEIPRLPTGKTDYRAILARGRAGAAPAAAGDGAPLREAIAAVLGLPAVSGRDSFVGLGGDSLNFVQVSILLERRLGHAPAGWERLPVAELEALARQRAERPAASGGAGSGFRSWARLDTTAVLRAVCIALVVLHHVSGWDMAGAAAALLVVGGFNFARFQLPQLEAGASGSVARAMLLRIVLPYFLILAAAFALRGGAFWPHYLLYANFTDGVAANGVRRLTIYWFIETYIVTVLALCALFLVPAVRHWSREAPLRFALAVFALGTALRAAGEHFFRFDPLFRPHAAVMLLYAFAFGWAAARTHGTARRAAILALGLVCFYFYGPAYQGTFTENGLEYSEVVFMAALAMLCLTDRVPVGRSALPVLTAVAGASFYIYMTHPFVVQPIYKLFPGTRPLWVIAIGTLLSLVLGYLVQRAVDRMPALWRRFRDRPRPQVRENRA